MNKSERLPIEILSQLKIIIRHAITAASIAGLKKVDMKWSQRNVTTNIGNTLNITCHRNRI